MDKVHRKAVEAEERVARVFDGYRTAASGSGTKDKADVLTSQELIEVKYTEKQSFSLKREDLERLTTYAFIKNRIPLFHITYGIFGSHFVVLRERDYLDLCADTSRGIQE